MNKKIFAFGILVLFISSLYQTPTSVNATTWWDTSWFYKKKVTIDATKIDADLTDFPILVILNSTVIDWSNVQDDLDDLRFIDSTETIILKAELEKYTVNTDAYIWVKIPAIDDAVDTDFYIYFGNVVASSAWDAENVWDPSAVMVQHMKDATTSTILDSTSYDNDGTKLAADEPLETSSGRVDSAQSFDGIDDSVNISNKASLQITGALTLSAWVKLDLLASNVIVAKGWLGEYWWRIESDNQMLFGHGENWGNFEEIRSGATGIVPGVYFHLAVIRNPVTMKLYFYVNGVQLSSPNYTILTGTSNLPVLIGKDSGGTYLDGIIDEVRINAAKSAEWIKADYYSTSNTLVTYSTWSYVVSPVGVGNSGWIMIAVILLIVTIVIYPLIKWRI